MLISQATVLTVGHSNHPLEEFLALLAAHSVERLVDVRRFPHSRRHPQFDGRALAIALSASGYVYEHRGGLGGFRTPRPDSPNTAWREDWFRGYADFMQTAEFESELRDLLSSELRTAIMCAEADPLHCHRRLIADALVARGVEVEHILSVDERVPHVLTPWAQVEDGRIVYRAAQIELDFIPPPSRT